jgi:deoxyribose-phosphate aldolase
VTRAQIARMIDHSQLRAYATQVDITELCDEALAHSFHAVAVNPTWVSFCTKKLAGSEVAIVATVGFPLGANTAYTKVEEAKDAVRNGASEIDMVINVGALKSGYPRYVEREIAAVIQAVRGIPVKVILETSYLTEAEKMSVSEMAVRHGAAFVKTCTGFGFEGAKVEDVALIKETVGDRISIKAAGGIRTYGDLYALFEAGATRFGTSAGVDILADAK